MTNLKCLGQNLIPSAANLTLFTVPLSETYEVNDILLCNNHTSSVTISIWLDNDGSSATNAERIYKDIVIPASSEDEPGTKRIRDMRQSVEGNGTMQLIADVNNVVSVRVSGLKYF